MALRKRGQLFKFAQERGEYPERGGGFPQKRGRETNPAGNYVIALLTKEKQLRMNRKTMTLTFFELYAVYIKKVQNPFSKVIKF